MTHSSTQWRLMLPAVFIARICVVIALLILFAGQLRAQGVGGTRGLPSGGEGIHTIQGRVYGPTGKPVTTRLRVRLESPDTSPMSSVTDEDGSFIFGRIPPGNYKLTVEGDQDFENSYEYPLIYREGTAGGRIVRLAIFMRLKESDEFEGAHKDAIKSYQKAREFDRAGDSKKAIEQLQKALAIYPRFAPALNQLGVQYLKLGQADKAAEALEAAVKLAPEEFQPRLNYGIALLNQKKFALAEEQLKVALMKNNAAPTAHMYLGMALMSQQKLDEAEQALLLAVSSNSNEVAAAHRYLGGIYWGRRDYKRAADELEAYLKMAPKAADAERTRAAIRELRLKSN